jgi:hypothetical protein
MEKNSNIDPHLVFNANITLMELRSKGVKALGDIPMMDLLSMLRNTCLETAKDSLDESWGVGYALVAERIHHAMEALALAEMPADTLRSSITGTYTFDGLNKLLHPIAWNSNVDAMTRQEQEKDLAALVSEAKDAIDGVVVAVEIQAGKIVGLLTSQEAISSEINSY